VVVTVPSIAVRVSEAYAELASFVTASLDDARSAALRHSAR